MSTDPEALGGAAVEERDRRFSTERKVQLGFAFALTCLAFASWVSFVSVLSLNRDAASVAHTYQVMNRLDALLSSVVDAQIGGRQYVNLGGEEYLERYRQGIANHSRILPQFRELTADNPA